MYLRRAIHICQYLDQIIMLTACYRHAIHGESEGPKGHSLRDPLLFRARCVPITPALVSGARLSNSIKVEILRIPSLLASEWSLDCDVDCVFVASGLC